MNWFSLLLVTWLASQGAAIVAAPPASGRPDMKTIAANGRTTVERLRRENARWMIIFETPTPGVLFQVTTTHSPSMRLFVVDVIEGSSKREIVRIIERDDYWYVSEGEKYGKYRPYEAPLSFPIVYSFLSRVNFYAVVEEIDLGDFESLVNNVARYRVEIPIAARNELFAILQTLESTRSQTQNEGNPSDAEAMIVIRDFLEKGNVREVDTRTGIQTTFGGLTNRRWVKNFEWLPRELASPFEIANRSYIDHTIGLLDQYDSPRDLVLFSYLPGWSPGQPPGETDVTLVDIRNGKIGRVYFPYSNSIFGCFAKDRRSVFVTGTVPDEGSVGLFQVDLLTRKIRRLATDLDDAYILKVDVSPDGKTLAAIGKTVGSSDPLLLQVFLVDVASGKTRRLGQPLDAGFHSWLPDASGLVLVNREDRDRDKPSVDTIVRMGMDGKLTSIRRGKMPLVLNPYKRIFFRDEEDQKWKVCDLTGKILAVIGDGMREFTLPTSSPDGRRVIMMREGGDAGPRPHMIDLVTRTATPINVGSGFWSFPSWR